MPRGFSDPDHLSILESAGTSGNGCEELNGQCPGSMNTTRDEMNFGEQHANEVRGSRAMEESGTPLVMPPALDCWYLTGPTAAGKTSVGMEMAQLLQAEIISLDSMAVYRGMNIGTAKPTAEQLQAVPHHLIDVLDPVEEFSVSSFVEAAHRLIGEIRAGDGKCCLWGARRCI